MKAKQIHCGQYKRYGDFYLVWEIETDGESEEEVLSFARENLCKKELPKMVEFKLNTRYGGAKFGDMDYYFRGYYILEKIPGGYRFSVVEPYAD